MSDEKLLSIINTITENREALKRLTGERYAELVKPYRQILEDLMKVNGWHVAEALHDTLNTTNNEVSDFLDQALGKAWLCAAAYEITVDSPSFKKCESDYLKVSE